MRLNLSELHLPVIPQNLAQFSEAEQKSAQNHCVKTVSQSGVFNRDLSAFDVDLHNASCLFISSENDYKVGVVDQTLL